MSNGKKSKSERRAEDVVRTAEKALRKEKAAFGLKGRAFGYEGGWDSDRGLYVRRANAFVQSSRARRKIEFRGSSRGAALERGTNPFVKSWGGQRANGFGQWNPKKDTIEPFDEFIGLINGNTSTTVEIDSFRINPGDAITFPQLSAMAKNYERYNFARLEFYLTPLVTVTASAGKIIMTCDLEGMEEADPATAAEMENNSIHSDGMPHETYGIQVAGVIRHQESWYIRTGIGYPPGGDPRNYDAGKLFVGAYANAATSAQMELRVRGIVELYDKIQEPTGVPKALEVSAIHITHAGLTTTVYDYVTAVSPQAQGTNAVPTFLDSQWEVGATYFVAPRTGKYRLDISAQFNNSAGTMISYKWRLTVSGVVIKNAAWTSGLTGNMDDQVLCDFAFFEVAAGDPVSVEINSTFSSGSTTVPYGQLVFTSV